LESIKWSKSIFNGVIDAIFIVDEKLNYIDVNTAAVRLTQFSDEELSTLNMRDLHTDHEQFKTYFTCVAKGETIRDYSEIIRKEGGTVPVEYRVSGITIEDRMYLLIVANDLTLRRRYQERLEALYEIALRMAEVNSLDAVADLCLSAINDVLKFNLCTFSLVEDNFIRFRYMNAESDINELPLDSSGITVRAVKTGEIQLVSDVSKDHDYVPCYGYTVGSELAVPVKVDGQVRALINVESEETDSFSQEDRDHVATLAELVSNALHRLDTKEYLEGLVEERTRELKRLNEQLVHLGEMKNQFINHVTHELRTPLTSINGYLEIMQSMQPSEIIKECEKFFAILTRNTDRLISLTDDLIEQQRIETNKLGIERAPTYLNELIEQSIENTSPMMHQKNQSITIDYDKTIPILDIDPIRIGQVMDNLLSNAIKYSPSNSKTTVKTVFLGDEIYVSVCDEGIGLSPEDMTELFKPFPAIDRPVMTENSTGLGLSICKGIIELHGGKIWAESEGRNRGSTFSFKLPIKRVD
ncbi:MAG: ATP-binding protein, partial [Candidatus Bathyarchaeota archaeon]|nr:ATP-binding protein [Candidatus Bathyarchaeota archaeon]